VVDNGRRCPSQCHHSKNLMSSTHLSIQAIDF
jgi:hypothetical protein